MPTFTDKMLKGLKPPASGQIDVWDRVLPCFGVRVGRKAKTFFVGVRINGRYRRITLGRYDRLSLKDARDKARDIINDAQSGISPELKNRREAKGSFGAVAEAFMTDYASEHRTRGEMQRMISSYLQEWHDRPVTEITRGEIKELLRVKARTAPIMANRLLSLITKIFNWALKEELIDSSPAIRIDRPGQERERERSLSAAEIETAWSAFDKLGYPFGTVYKMALVTGQRRGEVAGMKWAEITAEGWKLPGERAKKAKGHLVPLSSLAREILDGAPQIGELVFRSHRDAQVQNWSKAAKRLRKLCGPMEPWHLHDLRRTFATHLRSLGIDRLVVSKLLNHAEAGITKVYDRYSADAEKSAAMERWANRLREIITGEEPTKVVQMR
jgi:integrase